MTPPSNDLLSGLSRAHTDPVVMALLADLGLQGSKFKLKRGEADLAFDVPMHGIDVVFSNPAVHAMDPAVPQGALILSAVIFFAEGCQGHRQFAGSLPHGLDFKMRRPAVRKLLGRPDWTSPLLPVDRWDTGPYRMAIWFDETTEAVSYVNCSLPER